MKKKLINLCISLLLLLTVSNAFPQDECGTTVLSTSPVLIDIGGYLKPGRTDKSNNQNCDGTFKMLFVFIQFPDEDPESESTEWQIGHPPEYINKLFSENKLYTGNYWDRYSDQTQFFSDYYMEVSRGVLDVTGITRNIILDYTASEYNAIGGPGYNGMLSEIYYKLSQDQTIIWPDLDQWRRDNTTGLFEKAPDNYIDMIGLFFRTNPVPALFSHGPAGYVPLYGPAYQLPNNKLIGISRNEFGSGFVSLGWSGSPNVKIRNIGIAIHEIGHYLFDGLHSSSGIMTSRGGISINDFFYSGFERMKLGYVTANTVNYNFNDFQFDDVSGRDGTSNLMMKVPITTDDFFLIESRRKISQYDVYMLGDTVRLEPTKTDALDKGTGVYIYHSMNGNSYTGSVDLECADGLWDWTIQGTTSPDWNDGQQLPIIARNTAVYPPVGNDNGGWSTYGGLSNTDGLSAAYYSSNTFYPVYFTLGKRHIQEGQCGTVAKYTNVPAWYTSRELWGDRYDAWNIEYNEVFSPYSNPNTRDRFQTPTGIYIYYSGMTDNKASISIYKVGENGSQDWILEQTPPSKPMGIKHESLSIDGKWCVPKITWYHNQEPDMLRTDNTQWYEVWRATAADMNHLPDENNYVYLETVQIPLSVTPHYEDLTVLEHECAELDQMPPFGIEYPLRYRVKAVDKTNWASVRSDFVSTTGITPAGGIEGDGGDNPLFNSNTPKEYKLYQNYPNPFNPMTKINFALPKQGFVTLKIYDITGREIQILVSEVKQAGYYSVDFNGSSLSSGVYFYRIQSNDFVMTKRMVLIK